MKRIGVFGGTFNPVDNAHMTIAEQFVSEINLDKCYIIPTNISPFKTEEPIIISKIHRLKMLQIAFSDESKFEINTYEIDKEGVSYSCDTIKHIMSNHPGSDIFLLVGSDQAISFKEWKEWDWILINTQVCIAMRPGFSTSEELTEFLKINGKKPIILSSPLLNITATEIRNKIAKDESLSYFLPEKVERYIIYNKLYL